VLVGCWLARLLIQEWFSHLLQLTFLSKTDQIFFNSCRSSETQLSQLIFDTCTHHCPIEKNIKTGWIQCVDPQWCQRYKSEKQWKGSLPGCEWIVDLIKTILRVAMKWKFGDKRDMWCCPSPEWTVGLEAVLERNYFVQFWKEREKCKTAFTAHSPPKTQNGASALSLSLDGLPLGPTYLKSCVQIWSDQQAVCAQLYL